MAAGTGSLDIGLGYDSGAGLLGEAGLRYRINENLFTGLEGRVGYGLAGPRKGKLDGSILGVFGARW